MRNEKSLCGLRLKEIFQHILLARTYESVIDGKKIGATIPPHKKLTIFLNPDNTERAFHHRIRKELFAGEKDPVRERTKFRQLSMCATHPAFMGFTLKAEDLHKMGLWDQDLEALVGHLNQEFTSSESGNILEGLCEDAVKFRWLCFGVALKIFVEKTKIILWCEWPSSQLLLTKFFDRAGVKTRAMHAGLNPTERDTLVQGFNNNPEPEILVITYKIGATAINLQKWCYTNLIVEPAESLAIQQQAEARIVRIGQRRPQLTINVHALFTLNDPNIAHVIKKAIPQTAAFYADKDKKIAKLLENSDLEGISEMFEVLTMRCCAGVDNDLTPAEGDTSEDDDEDMAEDDDEDMSEDDDEASG